MSFNRPSENLPLCRHFATSSDLKLSIVPISAVAIESFSAVQRSHFLVPHTYGDALSLMLHVIA